MKLCPLCQAEYPDDLNHCVQDGERLIRLPERQNNLVGTVFNRRYRLEEKVGEGGMGAVYRGVQEPVGRPVAVKVLQSELAGNKTAVRRFFNEARVISRLRHPNTVTLYDFGQSDTGHLFIAMEYLSGESLNELIRRDELTLPEIVEITDQVCQSLEEAHEQGIVHRDLKPDNVFIDRLSNRTLVKVLDFGIAKVPDTNQHLTRTGMVFGTPTYMSPEQAQGHGLDHRTDVYTLGILLYEMVAGRPPFVAATPMQVALRHVTVEPLPVADVSRYRPLPIALASLIMDMLAKNPRRRPQTVAVIRTRLLRVARELPGLEVERTGDVGEVVRLSSQSATLPAAWSGSKPRRLGSDLVSAGPDDPETGPLLATDRMAHAVLGTDPIVSTRSNGPSGLRPTVLQPLRRLERGIGLRVALAALVVGALLMVAVATFLAPQRHSDGSMRLGLAAWVDSGAMAGSSHDRLSPERSTPLVSALNRAKRTIHAVLAALPAATGASATDRQDVPIPERTVAAPSPHAFDPGQPNDVGEALQARARPRTRTHRRVRSNQGEYAETEARGPDKPSDASLFGGPPPSGLMAPVTLPPAAPAAE